MKKFIKFIAAVLVLAALMFAEYRYIMINIKPYIGQDNTVQLEVFGQVDEYYAEPVDLEEE